MRLLLQQYEDGTYGYMGIDNLENEHGKVISEQGKFEEREDYINRCELTFRPNQYGSDLELDSQINDEKNWYDNIDIAEQGYGLEKLINDEEDYVREAVAKQGYGLEKLVNDEDYFVRTAVAKQGYGLEQLINDENWCVRIAVAEQGYGLEKLINDDDFRVREVASNMIVKFEKEDIMLKGDRYIDCKEYIEYFISKNNPKAIAKILAIQINNNWPCSEGVYDLVKKYAEDNNIQSLFKILEVYYEYCK